MSLGERCVLVVVALLGTLPVAETARAEPCTWHHPVSRARDTLDTPRRPDERDPDYTYDFIEYSFFRQFEQWFDVPRRTRK